MFSDFNQRLYRDPEDVKNWPDVTFKLYHNCRNPVNINKATNLVCDTEFQSLPDMTEGMVPTISKVSQDKMALRAWTLAHDLYPKGGSVILSPYAFANSVMSDAPQVWHKLKLTQDPSKIGEEGYVYFSTIKSSKGLKRRT